MRGERGLSLRQSQRRRGLKLLSTLAVTGVGLLLLSLSDSRLGKGLAEWESGAPGRQLHIGAALGAGEAEEEDDDDDCSGAL